MAITLSLSGRGNISLLVFKAVYQFDNSGAEIIYSYCDQACVTVIWY